MEHDKQREEKHKEQDDEYGEQDVKQLGEEHGEQDVKQLGEEHDEQDVEHSEQLSREEWRRRRYPRRCPCTRCGLVHWDYDIAAWLDGLDEFDCKVLLPNLNDVKMEGNTILLSPEILKMTDELVKARKKKATETKC